MNEQDIQNLWDRFLEVWSVDRVKDMTLEEYIQVGSKNSFTYWLEHVTKPIADIRGGDASKFGIFHRRNQQNKENGRGRIYDNEYCWFEKFGTTKEQAFQTIKNNILNIISAVRSNNLDDLQSIQISDMFKWKIAYLYQNQKDPSIVPIFSKAWLDFLTGDNNLTYAHAYKYLLEKKDKNFSIQEYGNQLAKQYLKANPKKNVKEELSQYDSIISYDDEVEDNTVPLSEPLNRILFGAAGTGKTFNTINHTLSIIENKSLEKLGKENRDELKIRFDKYKKEGKVKFVTFHQSFSYEDFVEGIRAETDDQKKLSYNVKAGVFKEICDLAKSDQLTSLLGTEFGRGYILKSISSDMLIIQKPNGNLIHLALDLAFLLFESVVQKKITIEDINQKRVLDKLEDNPLLEPYIINGYCAVWANLIQMMLTAREVQNSQKTPYVLIIDEINRGNISRIFGELITLIEESKRTGAEEELSVTLPYSKQEFTVPSNLYIIGTMNSSDRSLTGLDVALRRRFTFIEMPPRPDLLKDKNGQPIQINAVNQEGVNMSVNISELLTVINQRIEVLLDRDHCIGHANFMSLNSQSTVEELAQIFKQKIIPQLQEYFFDDWSKINMVLNGNGMLEATSLERSKIFPNVNTEEIGFFDEQKIWNLVESEFDNIQSFAKIIKH